MFDSSMRSVPLASIFYRGVQSTSAYGLDQGVGLDLQKCCDFTGCLASIELALCLLHDWLGQNGSPRCARSAKKPAEPLVR